VDTAPNPNRRRRLSIGAGVVLVLLALAIAVIVSALGPRGSSEIVTPGGPAVASDGPVEPGLSASEPPPGANGEGGPSPAASTGSVGAANPGQSRAVVFVHIIGAVTSPGLYELHEGDRAVDAVAAAGGLTPDADQAQLNLARFLSDGEQIIVPRVGEVPPPAAAGVGPGGAGGSVNINTADAAALEQLPGVGPALAERIVLWRETNGNFTAVDDLLNVTGIGQKKLDGMRESVAL
jgi:competence protein ComEA